MGVHGLWKLIEASGKPVPIETLESKVLAVDVSIWLHQVVKGFQDSRGNPLPNAHLLGLFHRICKLLFYKIRPVFVFDGGVPHLKKLTVVARRQQKNKAEKNAEQTREKLLKNLIKHKALNKALGDRASSLLLSAASTSVSGEDDMFHIPASQAEYEQDDPRSENPNDNEDSEEDDILYGGKYRTTDLHAIDVSAAEFTALPANVRHDILSELKETRKQSSWGKLHEIPKEQDDFSSYQMNRLLKRRAVQASLEEAEKEMGGRTLSLGELEELLKDQGVSINSEIGRRIASDNVTRFVYMKDSPLSSPEKKISSDSCSSTPEKPKASESSKVTSEIILLEPVSEFTSSRTEATTENDTDIKVPSVVDHKNLANCQLFSTGSNNSVEEKVTSSDKHKSVSFVEMENNFIESIENSDEYNENSDEDVNVMKDKPEFQLAHSFMFENSGLTQKQILKIIKTQGAAKVKDIMSSEGLGSHKDSCPSKAVASTSKNTYASYEVDKDDLTQHEILSLISCESKVVPVNEENDKSKITVKETSMTSNVVSEERCNENEMNSECELQSDEIKTLCIETVSEKTGSLNEIQLESKHVENTVVTSKHDSKAACEAYSVKEPNFKPSDIISQNETSKNTDTPFEQSKSDNIEIVIKCDTKNSLENDIFADVFSKFSEQNNKIVKNGLSVVMNKTGDVNKSDFIDCVEPSDVGLIESTEESDDGNDDHSGMTRDNENVAELTDSFSDVNNTESLAKEATAKKSEAVTNVEDLIMLQDTLEQKHADLLAERGKQERLATSITDQMVLEAQELLQLFGIPYIVAPMEAEAQCAFLDSAGLTEGTITDDSDIWLFGGRLVYKNFFSMKKEVMQFKFMDINHYFKLTREQLVLLALLVGSDYTEGLQGVGPVTALEILASFPLEQDNEDLLYGLKRFTEWLNNGKLVGPGKTILRNKLKNVHLMQGFPNQAVVNAYLHPDVDESKEKFSWSAPNLSALKEYAKTKFRWTPKKTEDILVPVMKKLSESKFQRSLSSYFKTYPTVNPGQEKMSKRVRDAIRVIGNEDNSDVDDPEPKKTKISRSRCKKSVPKATKLSNSTLSSADEPSCSYSDVTSLSPTDEPSGSCIGVTPLSSAQEPSSSNSLEMTVSSYFSSSCSSSGVATTSTSLSRAAGIYNPSNCPSSHVRNRLSRNLSGAVSVPAPHPRTRVKPEGKFLPKVNEFIPQREKEKMNLLKNKLKAIETFRKSKRGLDKTKREICNKRPVLKEAHLSESSSSDES